MTQRSPFLVFPWDRRFLPLLLDRALEDCGGDPGRALFIFPHARPARYMLELLRENKSITKPCLLPEMMPVSSFFSAVRAAAGTRPLLDAGMLDQVALLLDCVRRLEQEGAFAGIPQWEDRSERLAQERLPLDDPKRFFPWGMRLASLMEEFFTHNVQPSNYAHLEGEVSPFAAALLSRLASIHALYIDALEERGWTTPGLDARTAALHANAALDLTNGRQVFIAGFHTLNGCEDAVFRTLWENGARVCLHADPATVPDTGTRSGTKHRKGASPHWSCHNLIRWAQSWHAGLEADISCTTPPPHPERSVRFVAGFDLHSQLTAMEKDLAATGAAEGNYESTAVVLPEASLLLPVLHHLPDVDVNISMGYPLSRSPLFRLLESIMEVQERAVLREKGPEPDVPDSWLYHWKAAVALIRHPYLKMLEPVVPDDSAVTSPASGATLRRLLHGLEEKLRNGRRYVDLAALARELLEEQAEPADTPLAALFTDLLDTVVGGWEAVDSPATLAAALERTVSLLVRHGAALWKRFPIDAECLYRLMQSVIPQLAQSALKDEALDRSVLFLMLRRLLAAERAPFEADPLVSLQVMGVLETRLLSFDRLFILDATEDRLPGSPAQDPLLPDSLRTLAGLPDSRGRERVAAYNFFRLVHGARECVIYWQEGVEPQGLADGKKLRSRFVEELIWREEEKRRELLAPEKHGGEHGPLRHLRCALPPLPLEHRSIIAGPAAKERIKTIVAGGLSASLLDSYLGCPARFFHERIGRLKGIESVNEQDDPRELGSLLHKVLQDYFATRLGRPVTADAEARKALLRHFRTALHESPLSLTLPADSLVMLEEAGPERLLRLLAAQEGSIPLRVEEELQATFYIRGKGRLLKGILDRVDEREEGTVILDYKTGNPKKPDTSLWTDDAFWESVEDFLELDAADIPAQEGFIEHIAERVASVQLPSYLFLYSHGAGLDADNAAYVTLSDKAEELFLFNKKTADAVREEAADKIPLLLAAIVRHMEESPAFAPRPGAHCDWCSCKSSCMVLATR